MINIQNDPDDRDLNVPFLSQQLADHLLFEFSADKQIDEGLLSDPEVVRSEAYLLGFLAGLGYSRSVLTTILRNQEGISMDAEDITESYVRRK